MDIMSTVTFALIHFPVYLIGDLQKLIALVFYVTVYSLYLKKKF